MAAAFAGRPKISEVAPAAVLVAYGLIAVPPLAAHPKMALCASILQDLFDIRGQHDTLAVARNPSCKDLSDTGEIAQREGDHAEPYILAPGPALTQFSDATDV